MQPNPPIYFLDGDTVLSSLDLQEQNLERKNKYIFGWPIKPLRNLTDFRRLHTLYMHSPLHTSTARISSASDVPMTCTVKEWDHHLFSFTRTVLLVTINPNIVFLTIYKPFLCKYLWILLKINYRHIKIIFNTLQHGRKPNN